MFYSIIYNGILQYANYELHDLCAVYYYSARVSLMTEKLFQSQKIITLADHFLKIQLLNSLVNREHLHFLLVL